MIDLKHLEQYKENNRIEAKRATGGLPHSIWETYSAFANTLGGLILLGVEEQKDKSFHAVALPDAERLRDEFFTKLSDQKIVKQNLLSPEDVRIETVDGKQIIVIEVPQAKLCQGPIAIDRGQGPEVYKRTGEGDYLCTEEDVRKMFQSMDKRDAVYDKQKLIDHLTTHIECTVEELAEVLASFKCCDASCCNDHADCYAELKKLAEQYLVELIKEDLVVSEDIYSENGEKRFKYRLRA